MRYSTIGTAVALAMLLTPALAAASTYDLDFTFAGESGDLVLTTSGPVSAGGTLVTKITGTVIYDAHSYSVSELAPDAFASNDNLLYSGSPEVDLSGLGFTFDGMDQSIYWTGGYASIPKAVQTKYDLPARDLNYDGAAFSYQTGPKKDRVTRHVLGDTGQIALCVIKTCSNSTGFVPGTISITSGAIPEPTTWAMMLVGFSGLGAAMRSRRRRTITA